MFKSYKTYAYLFSIVGLILFIWGYIELPGFRFYNNQKLFGGFMILAGIGNMIYDYFLTKSGK